MSQTYYQAVRENIETALAHLDEYSKNISRLKENDFFAIDRLLQITVESGIGISKQIVKKKGWPVAADARKNFERLKDEGIISAKELDEWKKAIGMRNVLIHDYLNIDRNLVKKVLQDHAYHLIKSLLKKAKTIL